MKKCLFLITLLLFSISAYSQDEPGNQLGLPRYILATQTENLRYYNSTQDGKKVYIDGLQSEGIYTLYTFDGYDKVCDVRMYIEDTTDFPHDFYLTFKNKLLGGPYRKYDKIDDEKYVFEYSYFYIALNMSKSVTGKRTLLIHYYPK